MLKKRIESQPEDDFEAPLKIQKTSESFDVVTETQLKNLPNA